MDGGRESIRQEPLMAPQVPSRVQGLVMTLLSYAHVALAVAPALVWGQVTPLMGSSTLEQVRTSKNRMTKRRRTAVVSGVAPHTSSTAETDVATGLTGGAGDAGRGVGRSLRVLDVIVELGGAGDFG